MIALEEDEYYWIPEELKNKTKSEYFLKYAKEFQGFKQWADDYRHPTAGKNGGFALTDQEHTSRLRSAGKEILKTAGKLILTGKFNLTTISFPIKCMCPTSMLELIGMIAGVNPLYMLNAA